MLHKLFNFLCDVVFYVDIYGWTRADNNRLRYYLFMQKSTKYEPAIKIGLMVKSWESGRTTYQLNGRRADGAYTLTLKLINNSWYHRD